VYRDIIPVAMEVTKTDCKVTLDEYNAVITPTVKASQTVNNDNKSHFVGLFLLAFSDSDMALHTATDIINDAPNTVSMKIGVKVSYIRSGGEI
jgi:hypothetical protein